MSVCVCVFVCVREKVCVWRVCVCLCNGVECIVPQHLLRVHLAPVICKPIYTVTNND